MEWCYTGCTGAEDKSGIHTKTDKKKQKKTETKIKSFENDKMNSQRDIDEMFT